MSSEHELAQLTRQFGAFERATFEFQNLAPDFVEWVEKLTRRRGEIVLVVPRGQQRVLLHTKPHYPDQVYRLLTGGVQPREDAADAAVREAYEEIGFRPETLQLLGVLENIFWVGDKKLVYPSFVFQTREWRGEPVTTDPDEAISGFRDADALELRGAGIHLASLPGGWRDWGRFRAAAHMWLTERLKF